MYKIAICDDKINTIKGLEEYLNTYFDEKKVSFSLSYYETPEKLFEAMEDQLYNIVFMDLAFDSEENDGILWSCKLNEKYPQTLVIILTAYESRVKEGYVARAFRFMTKPIICQELRENMDACLNELGGSQTIKIYPLGIELVIAVRDIIYLEAYAGGSVIYLKDNHYYCEESLIQWEQTLPKNLFFRSHKKYLVNLGHIEKLDHHEIIFSQGTRLPASRRKWTKLREEFMKYDIHHLG